MADKDPCFDPKKVPFIIKVSHDHASLNGYHVRRPVSVSISEWEDFWENALSGPMERADARAEGYEEGYADGHAEGKEAGLTEALKAINELTEEVQA